VDYTRYLDHLAATARARPDVVGLAAFGSTAEQSRRDEWSDHDFAWITTPGAEDGYRHSADWLPDRERIVAHVVEWHGGVKVLYEDGRLAEFGVTTLDGLSAWEMNRATALVDPTGDLQRVLDTAAAASRREVAGPDQLALAATAVVVGVGRGRRGEVLSAGSSVRGAAVEHILRALATTTPGAFPPLDPLDPHRRVERVHPDVAAQIADACSSSIEEAGRALLQIIEDLATDDRTRASVAAVRGRLGWGDDGGLRPDGGSPAHAGRSS